MEKVGDVLMMLGVLGAAVNLRRSRVRAGGPVPGSWWPLVPTLSGVVVLVREAALRLL
jgi:hypothetical protein